MTMQAIFLAIPVALARGGEEGEPIKLLRAAFSPGQDVQSFSARLVVRYDLHARPTLPDNYAHSMGGVKLHVRYTRSEGFRFRYAGGDAFEILDENKGFLDLLHAMHLPSLCESYSLELAAGESGRRTITATPKRSVKDSHTLSFRIDRKPNRLASMKVVQKRYQTEVTIEYTNVAGAVVPKFFFITTSRYPSGSNPFTHLGYFGDYRLSKGAAPTAPQEGGER